MASSNITTGARDDTPELGRSLRPGGPVRRASARVRNLWRQLTSMRTALFLLFLLAMASLPGALLPQWTLNKAKTAQFILDHPTWGPWLDRLGFFTVFASPWYAAIYLLLFTSLVGCLLPRSVDFARQLRTPPVATPRNLGRLPHHRQLLLDGSPTLISSRILDGLSAGRWRTLRCTESDGAVTISAERGYLREVGNLIFHLSLLGLVLAVAVGKLVGYEGSVIVDAGSGFCSVGPAAYDNFRPGILVDGTDMTPFCVDVDAFHSTYSTRGQALQFAADIRYQSGPDLGSTIWTPQVLQVNDPLRINGERLYLLGHGFTPHFRVTYPGGAVRDYAQPFQPMDGTLVSQGAVKITDPPDRPGRATRTHQLAIVAVFAPTARITGGVMTSAFPAAHDPGVAVQVYRGDLGMETGRPQSVFAIDTRQVDRGGLVKEKQANLQLGQAIRLDDGTTVTFNGFNEWVSLQTSYDPAQFAALVSAILLLGGLTLSLTIKRRRVWFRLRADGDSPSGIGRTVVEVGGLARTDPAVYGEEFRGLAALAIDDKRARRFWKRSVESKGT